jgi:hypothetical protein
LESQTWLPRVPAVDVAQLEGIAPGSEAPAETQPLPIQLHHALSCPSVDSVRTSFTLCHENTDP